MSNLKNLKLLEFKSFSNYNGVLIPIEKNIIPFSIKRFFYIYRIKKDQIRGKHAHKKCEQVIICLKGGCEVICHDGKKENIIKLSNPKQGLYIPPMIWTIQKFTKDNSLLLVIASKYFSEDDYIRNFNKFLACL